MTKLERFIHARDILKWKALETGEVLNRKNNSIGCSNNFGYMYSSIIIDKKNLVIKFHQYIYWYFKNELPEQIDHINGIKHDNRLINLRACNNHQNQLNKKSTKGYTFSKRDNAFYAKICINGKRKHIGTYKTEEEARAAYLEAKKIYHDPLWKKDHGTL